MNRPYGHAVSAVQWGKLRAVAERSESGLCMIATGYGRFVNRPYGAVRTRRTGVGAAVGITWRAIRESPLRWGSEPGEQG